VKKFFFLLLNYITTFILLYLCYNKLEKKQLLYIINTIKPFPVTIAIINALFFKLIYFSWLWNLVFKLSKVNINFQEIFYLNANTLILKYIIPFKIAEIFRALGLKLISKIDILLALSGTIYLKLITIISIFTILIFSCMLKSNFHYLSYTLFLLSIFFIITQIVCFLPDNFFGIQFKQFKHCFAKISINGQLKVFIFTAIMELSEVISLYFIMIAFSVHLQLIDLLYFVGISKTASMIPISIQGIGVRESIAVAVFKNSIPNSSAFSIGFCLTIIYHLLPAISGLLICAYIRLKLMINKQ